MILPEVQIDCAISSAANSQLRARANDWLIFPGFGQSAQPAFQISAELGSDFCVWAFHQRDLVARRAKGRNLDIGYKL
jgi:hypothetical protein